MWSAFRSGQRAPSLIHVSSSADLLRGQPVALRRHHARRRSSVTRASSGALGRLARHDRRAVGLAALRAPRRGRRAAARPSPCRRCGSRSTALRGAAGPAEEIDRALRGRGLLPATWSSVAARKWSMALCAGKPFGSAGTFTSGVAASQSRGRRGASPVRGVFAAASPRGRRRSPGRDGRRARPRRRPSRRRCTARPACRARAGATSRCPAATRRRPSRRVPAGAALLAEVAADDRFEHDEVLAALRLEVRPRLAVARRGEAEVGAEVQVALRLGDGAVAARSRPAGTAS